MAFVTFMASTAGRAVRIVAGLVLISIGILVIGGTGGYVLAAIGLVPLAAGALDLCLIAPLFGAPIRGDAIRRATPAGHQA
jgi:hypothetical protein